MTRVYTEDEVRDKFLLYIHQLISYWDTVDERDCFEKLEGLAFSILSTLDGESVELPGFKVISNPHPDDEGFLKLEGKNWFPDDVNIAGCLHERWHSLVRKNLPLDKERTP